MVPEPWREREYGIGVPRIAEHSINNHSAFWAGVSFFISHFLLYKETSLMRLEGYANLQVLEIQI